MPCIRHGAGLLFCPDAIQPHTSVYSVVCRVNAIIPPTPQNSAQGFTETLQAICHVLRLLSGGASCYAVQPARRWRAYRQAQRLHRYQIPPPRQALHRSAQPPYYNKIYIKAQRCAPAINPCQTVQHTANHASPAGSRCFSRLALAWHRVSLALAWHCAFFLARRRGTIGGFRRISFRAFAR